MYCVTTLTTLPQTQVEFDHHIIYSSRNPMISNLYIPVSSALWDLISALGQLCNVDNAGAKGECIIHPQPLHNCPSALISLVMHCQLVHVYIFSALTDLRQPQFCWVL